MTSENRYLIVIAGPTAIGKTKLAIELAKEFNTEIISADSRQFYKELDVGVARPSKEELEAAPHHFIGNIPVITPYTVSDFEKDALSLLDSLFKKHPIVIMTGGSGLFIDAVVNGLDDIPPANSTIREELNRRLVNEGLPQLADELKSIDEAAYQSIDTNNPRRVLRALEIHLTTGKKPSEILQKKPAERPFTPIKIMLDMERELLYQRINQRVDIMMQQGLLDEVKSLLPYKHLNALKTVGYKELFNYLDGNSTLEEATELIKQHTRNYAKRQLTWFRKDTGYRWFHPQQKEEIISFIQTQLK